MDSTRTKDAAQLREKIEELERETSDKLAENEAQAQQDAIQDQIDAYDQYEQNTDEDLQAMLEDANNFADEVNSVLKMQETDLYEWMKANLKDYANSLEKAKEQMLLSWRDMYKEMYGITDTWWDQVDEILSSEENFINYMTRVEYDENGNIIGGNDRYWNASEMDRQYMIAEWEDQYRTWVEAWKTGAKYFHDDQQLNGTGQSGGGGGGSGSGTKKKTEYDKARQDQQPTTITTPEEIDYKSDSDKANRGSAVQEKTEIVVSVMQTSAAPIVVTRTEYPDNNSGTNSIVNNSAATATTDLNQRNKKKNNYVIPGNAQGGIVDYTGLAWVDGTISKPEAFLSADDTALMRAMLDAAKYVSYRPSISNIDGTKFNNNSANIGDVNITITEAQFKEDADYDKVAERVGQAFVRELNKQGMNMANYAFG